jgi:enterochelin esterase-like enzyme
MKTSMRGIEYDVVSDRYPQFLDDELLAAVAKQYNMRTDAYSHAITGLSSGGICAFNAGWQRPNSFSRIITWIGSFTAIQWHETPEQTSRPGDQLYSLDTLDALRGAPPPGSPSRQLAANFWLSHELTNQRQGLVRSLPARPASGF